MSDVVSANEAAHRFGLSEKTVRRWIAAGKLNADKVGRAYRVSLSEVEALTVQRTTDKAEASPYSGPNTDNGSASSTTDSRSGMYGIAELVALVDRLQADNRELAATATVWQERAHVLGEQLALAAPAPAESPAEGEETASPPNPIPETPPPRWRRYGALVALIVLAAVGATVIGLVVLRLVPS
jgi:excisionase family DNA binding protein